MHEEIAFFKEKQDVLSRNEGLFVNDLKKENETLRKKSDELNRLKIYKWAKDFK